MNKPSFSILLTAIALILLNCTVAQADGPVVRFVSSKAKIIKAAGQSATAVQGMPLSVGDSIVVVGHGSVVIADPEAEVEVEVGGLSSTMYLGTTPGAGASYSVPDGRVRFTIVQGNKLEATTPHMVASVRGTQFTTDVTPSGTLLSVSSGVVHTGDSKGKLETVSAGGQVAATSNGFAAPQSGAMLQHRKEVQNRNTKTARSEKQEKTEKAEKEKKSNAGGNSGKGNSGGGKGKGNSGGNGNGNSGGGNSGGGNSGGGNSGGGNSGGGNSGGNGNGNSGGNGNGNSGGNGNGRGNGNG